MNNLKKIIILVVICCCTSCNDNSKQVGYTIEAPYETEDTYVAIKSVTQKNKLEIDGTEYTPDLNHVFYVVDLEVMNKNNKYSIDNLKETVFRCGVLEDEYILKTKYSIDLSAITDKELENFISAEKKHIVLVFEGLVFPEEASAIHIDIANKYIFLITTDELLIEQ